MTLLQAVQEANELAFALPDRLAFANLTEFNSFVDSFTFPEYPINLVIPFTVNSEFIPPFTKDTAIIRGYMLTRIEQDTNDWRSPEIETLYIQPMRDLVKQFVKNLLLTEVIDNSRNATLSMSPEYMFLHPHLFGVMYSINLPVIQKVC